MQNIGEGTNGLQVKQLADMVRDLGTITITIRRLKSWTSATKRRDNKQPTTSRDTIPEKALKGQAVSHQTR